MCDFVHACVLAMDEAGRCVTVHACVLAMDEAGRCVTLFTLVYWQWMWRAGV